MMSAMKINYLKSAAKPEDYPFPYKPEVAVVGRSNAGKSSFINAITGQKIAKTSQTPGKTRLLNFFEISTSLYLVDMPGYGFATGDREEVKSWKSMIETYFKQRETLKGVILVMDIRRDWAEEEQMLKEWLQSRRIEWGLVLNKADKLSRSQIMNRARVIAQAAGDVPVFALSSMKKQGLDDVKNLVFKEWPK